MKKIKNIRINNYPELIPCKGIKDVTLNPEITGGILYKISLVLIDSCYMDLIRDCSEVFINKTLFPKNNIEWIFFDEERRVVSIVHPKIKTIPIG